MSTPQKTEKRINKWQKLHKSRETRTIEHGKFDTNLAVNKLYPLECTHCTVPSSIFNCQCTFPNQNAVYIEIQTLYLLSQTVQCNRKRSTQSHQLKDLRFTIWRNPTSISPTMLQPEKQTLWNNQWQTLRQERTRVFKCRLQVQHHCDWQIKCQRTHTRGVPEMMASK